MVPTIKNDDYAAGLMGSARQANPLIDGEPPIVVTAGDRERRRPVEASCVQVKLRFLENGEKHLCRQPRVGRDGRRPETTLRTIRRRDQGPDYPGSRHR